MAQDQKPKNYKTEWSFSFEKLGDNIREFVTDVTNNAEEEIKSATYSAEIAGAAAARVRIDLSVGETAVTTLPATEDVIVANLIYVGEIKFVAETDADNVRIIHLNQSAGAREWFRGALGWFGSKQKLRWDIGITPSIPVDLDIRGGVGTTNLDLTGMNISALHVAGGAGEIDLHMPTGTYAATVDVGVGQISITIPTGAHVELNVGGGVGQINLDIEDGATASARLRGGVGEFNVRVPENTPISLTAKSGIGGINVPARLIRLSGTDTNFDRSGMWQSTSFEGVVADTRPIIIHYDGGIGSFNLR